MVCWLYVVWRRDWCVKVLNWIVMLSVYNAMSRKERQVSLYLFTKTSHRYLRYQAILHLVHFHREKTHDEYQAYHLVFYS